MEDLGSGILLVVVVGILDRLLITFHFHTCHNSIIKIFKGFVIS